MLNPTSLRARSRLSRRHTTGLSMIEVLVSMVVLALGLIGAARLLTSAVQNAAGTDTAARASQLAFSIIDDMRAQPSTPTAYALAQNATPATGTVAGDNLHRWITAVKALPGGNGKIEISATDPVAKVTVTFSDCAGSLSQEQMKKCVDNSPTRSIEYEARL